jgi:hypothetical protein
MASATMVVASKTWASMTGALMFFTPSIYTNISSEHSFSEVFTITEIIIGQWSVYGCSSLVRNWPHLDLIVIIGKIVPMITNRTHVHALHHLPHLLVHCLLELLEFTSPRSLLVTSGIIKGIITIAPIGHDQDKACFDTSSHSGRLSNHNRKHLLLLTKKKNYARKLKEVKLDIVFERKFSNLIIINLSVFYIRSKTIYRREILAIK